MKPEEMDRAGLIEEIECLKARLRALEGSCGTGRLAQGAILESVEIYRVLTETVRDFVFVIGRDLKVLYVNSFCTEFLGARKEEVLGRPLSEIFPTHVFEAQERSLRRVLESGCPFFVESSFNTHGRQMWLSTRLSPITAADGSVKAVLGISRDITERVRLTGEIRKERDMAQKYLDMAGVVILILRPDQTVALINKKGCELLGRREDEIIGRNWFDSFVPERIRDEVKGVFARTMAGELETARVFENPVLAGGVVERLIEWKNTVLTDSVGRVVASLSAGEDITERRKAEDEREDLIAGLTEALGSIKTLRGLLPICASCKKIRDDKGYWRSLEVYIAEHSEADFSHSICPECSGRLFPGITPK